MTPDRYCPVCTQKRTDPEAIKAHNERCARTGERVYPPKRRT